MAGRRPLPTKLKRLKGTLRTSRENPNEPQPEVSLPDPPDHLDEIATDEYYRVADELLELGLLSEIDRTALAGYASSYSLWVQTTEAIKKDGITVERANGDIVPHPLLHVQYKAQQQMRLFLVEFGMSPASRSKVAARHQESEKVESPFARIGRRRP